MASTVREIMNPELFALHATQPCDEALDFILGLDITSAPVLDARGRPIGVVSFRDLLGCEDGTVAERMTHPVDTVAASASIEDAGRALGASGRRHLVAVDAEGRAVGLVSALDVVRGLLGLPIAHPDAFPHFDELLHVCWSDQLPMDLAHVDAAPSAAGLLVLIRGRPGVPDRPVWAEACHNVQSRLLDLLTLPQTDSPILQRNLERDDLRFRTAVVADPEHRRDALAALQAQIAGSLRPPAFAD